MKIEPSLQNLILSALDREIARSKFDEIPPGAIVNVLSLCRSCRKTWRRLLRLLIKDLQCPHCNADNSMTIGGTGTAGMWDEGRSS